SFWNSDANNPSPGAAAGNTWDGAWHLVTGVYDGQNHIYVDGVEVGTGATAVASAYGNGDLNFGSYDTSGNFGWQGGLDDIKIFGTALTAQQILTNYLQALGGTLVGWWKAESN